MECPSPAVSARFAAFQQHIAIQDLQANGGGGSSVARRLLESATDLLLPARYKRAAQDASDSIYTTLGYYYSSPPSTATAAGASGAAPSAASLPSSAVLPTSAAVDLATVSAAAASLAAIREPQLPLQLAFAMDSVHAVRDLPKHFPGLRSQIVYVADPQYFAFAGGVKLYKGDTLVSGGGFILKIGFFCCF